MRVPIELDAIRDLVRAGRTHEARERIHLLSQAKLARSERLRLAFLANSSLAHRSALRILYRTVHPDERSGLRATEEERAEYAIALVSLGAYEEGIEILSSVQSQLEARAVGLLAFAYFKLWDWDTPLPWLRKVLAQPSLTHSERIRAKTQLALALLHGQGDVLAARQLLEELVSETGQGFFVQNHWDGLQILLQTYYLERDWAGARGILQKLEALEVNQSTEHFRLVAQKWRQLIALQSPRTRATGLRELGRTRKELHKIRHWEQVRSCDFYKAISLKDERLLTHLYYGSRYPRLREKLLTAFSFGPSDLPSHYDWVLGRANKKQILHVFDGRNGFGPARLPAARVLQRLLSSLTSDFYVPFNNVQLHRLLYPGELLNPVTAYDRTEKSIRRLRAWIGLSGVPLVLERDEGWIRVASSAGLRLRLELDPNWRAQGRLIDPKVKDFVLQLRAYFGGTIFTAQNVQTLLGRSRPTTVALLNLAAEAQLLRKLGNGPSTCYSIVD